MVFVYILLLKNGKYYIGKTTNPKFRLEQHFDSSGSAWTRKYKPVKVEKIIPNCDNFDEDKWTKKYMEKYGIGNVRGGSYTSIELSEEEENLLDKELNSANDECFRCGEKGHFAAQCPYESEEEEIVWCCRYCGKEFETEKGAALHENIHCKEKHSNKKKGGFSCFRCGRIGHFSPDCYARTHVEGYYL